VPEIQSRQFTITSGRDARAESLAQRSAIRRARGLLGCIRCRLEQRSRTERHRVQITPDNRDICRERALLSVGLGEPALPRGEPLSRSRCHFRTLRHCERQTRSRKWERADFPVPVPDRRVDVKNASKRDYLIFRALSSLCPASLHAVCPFFSIQAEVSFHRTDEMPRQRVDAADRTCRLLGKLLARFLLTYGKQFIRWT